jgi:hypothetical protein
METFMANIAKGRLVELYNRVKSNDPASSAFILVPLTAGGTEGQGQDFDNLEALLEDANFTEQTGGGWARKTLTDSELAALPAPNDEANRYDLPSPEVNFGEPEAANDTVGLAICYDANTGTGDDGDLLFIGCMDFTVEADGNEVVLKEGTLFQAS